MAQIIGRFTDDSEESQNVVETFESKPINLWLVGRSEHCAKRDCIEYQGAKTHLFKLAPADDPDFLPEPLHDIALIAVRSARSWPTFQAEPTFSARYETLPGILIDGLFEWISSY
jgi:hypothetical protein